MKTVLVTGGCGYVGSVLVPKLLAQGHDVRVVDTLLFGNHLAPHPRLQVLPGDIRDSGLLWRALQDVECVIHLAAIANDPSVELDPRLGREVNYDAFEPLVHTAKRRGVGRFIYASTSSVYGVSDAPEVTEDHPVLPITQYNYLKAACEPILLGYQSLNFTTVILRPATLCGYSPRQRLDLVVNILTNSAVNTGTITVLGGNQRRPSLHIQDMADVYVQLVDESEDLIAGEVFNVACDNHSVSDLAVIVKEVVERETHKRVKIKTEARTDERSYHISWAKIQQKLGWQPKYNIEDAITELCTAFKDGKLPNPLEDPQYYNVRTLRLCTVQ